MKKVCLSLGAIVLSGFVLASCGNTIKKPKSKGSEVNSISVDVNGQKIELNKDSSFKDVDDALVGFDFYPDYTMKDYNCYSYAYTAKTKASAKYTRTNFIENPNHKYMYETYSQSMKEELFTDAYFKEDTDSNSNYSKETYFNTYTKYSASNKSNVDSMKGSFTEIEMGAGTYNRDRGGNQNVDFGKYDYVKSNVTTSANKESTTEKAGFSTYKYVNDKEESNDEHYGDYKYGYDTDGKEYKYSITEAFKDPYSPSIYTLDYYLPYDEGLGDICDYKFELTDNYIIITGTSSYTPTVAGNISDYFNKYGISYDSNTVKNLINTDYKGSKVKTEIWIDYTNERYDNHDSHYLTLSYANISEKFKVNYKRVYNQDYLDNVSYDEEFENEIKGKEYTVKGTQKASIILGSNKDDYSKKISKLQKKCKKNNAYKNIEFKYYD